MDNTLPAPDAQPPSNAEPPFSFRDRIVIQSHLESLAEAARERALEAEVERLAKERGLMPAEPAKPPRRHRPSLRAVLDSVKRAGGTAVILPNGSIRITFDGDTAAAADEANPFDRYLDGGGRDNH